MAMLPPIFLDAVTAIGVDGEDGKRHWIGTGFLYGRFVKQVDESSNEYSVFLVTNKHVLSGLKRIYLKFNSAADSTSKDYPIDLVAKNGKPIWVGHPDTDIDVAVMLVDANQLKNELRKFALFQSNNHVLTPDQLKTDGVSEGDGVFVLGFPMGMVDQERQYVICRAGSIARIRDLIDGKATNFLVDATVFPGNSGGPVIIRPEFGSITGTKAIKSASLIGIVKSYVTYRDVAVSQQTNSRRIVFEENSGLTTVEPVEHVFTAVELAMKRTKDRVAQARWQAKRQMMPLPESTSTRARRRKVAGP
ncbi:MAG: S1 family peptidase [Ilumatobacteraceae bacterium]